MIIKMPLRAVTSYAFPSERTPNDSKDTHFAIFDAKQGCVAHVFDAELAERIATAVNCQDELVRACSLLIRDWENGNLSEAVQAAAAALKKAGAL